MFGRGGAADASARLRVPVAERRGPIVARYAGGARSARLDPVDHAVTDEPRSAGLRLGGEAALTEGLNQ